MIGVGRSVIVVGAGIFGVTASLELRRRGWNVTLVDPGPVPHPLAASTDISKVVRLAYGSDEIYTALMEEAIGVWKEWNRRWPEPLYHETGILVLTHLPMAPGSFEAESLRVLEARGRRPIRLDASEVRRRYPAWKAESDVGGFFHAESGYAESGRVVDRLSQEAREAGIVLRPGVRVEALIEAQGQVRGVALEGGERLSADRVVVAAGAWTSRLLPHLAGSLRATAHPIYHFRPEDDRLFRPEVFPVFTADISETGWYGFPRNRDGIVKIANHGVGRDLPVDAPRTVAPDEEAALRRFLEETFPTLAKQPIAEKRFCFYCDTRDEHFWIDEDPDRPGLIVAAGDSGHAFKFAPVLGGIIADVVEKKPSPLRSRFRWRPEIAPDRGAEEARHHG